MNTSTSLRSIGQHDTMMERSEEEIPRQIQRPQQGEESSVYDVVPWDGDEDTSSSAEPRLFRWHYSQPLERRSLHPVPLHRYRSEPICDSGRSIKLRSSYDIRKVAVEHDELPTVSEKERRLRDAFRRETRAVILSELASGSTDPSAESSPRRRKVLMSSIDCPGVPTEVQVETPMLRSVYNKVQGRRIDLVSTTLAYLATQ